MVARDGHAGQGANAGERWLCGDPDLSTRCLALAELRAPLSCCIAASTILHITE
jgi:hypothetical protein